MKRQQQLLLLILAFGVFSILNTEMGIIGILLLVVLALMVLLLLIPFCADVSWEQDTLTVKAGALGITFPVFQYPKPEPPPTSAQARSSATIFPALPPFFFCSGAGADGCGCAAAGCSKLYG
mgnify:CR=1 FL=1